jgi:3-hydroxyisobutyrate dehydrogenase
MNETIGFIGLGVMGRPMAKHILAKGHKLVGCNRSRGPVDEIVKAGGIAADTPADVARQATIVITMVPDTPDVEHVLNGPNGVLSALQRGSVVIDMSSISPVATRRLAAEVAKHGGTMLDAPVSGGEVGAINATLSIMIGGDKAAIDTVMPLFEVMGKRIMVQGGAGAGQHTKMSNQIVIAGTMVGVCESLLYAYKAGLSLETMVECIRGGAAACWALDNLAPRVIKRDFAPGFFVEHFIKDMGIALAEADRMNIALPGLSLVHQLYIGLRAQGDGRRGTQALMLALERMSKTGPDA